MNGSRLQSCADFPVRYFELNPEGYQVWSDGTSDSTKWFNFVPESNSPKISDTPALIEDIRDKLLTFRAGIESAKGLHELMEASKLIVDVPEPDKKAKPTPEGEEIRKAQVITHRLLGEGAYSIVRLYFVNLALKKLDEAFRFPGRFPTLGKRILRNLRKPEKLVLFRVLFFFFSKMLARNQEICGQPILVQTAALLNALEPEDRKMFVSAGKQPDLPTFMIYKLADCILRKLYKANREKLIITHLLVFPFLMDALAGFGT